MAFYYVKSGGTATGDAGRATTARTGSFASMGASAYYDSIYDLFNGAVPTTSPADGDTIFISDAHAKVYSGASNLTINITVGADAYFKFLAVDDSNCDQLSTANVSAGAGARETFGDGTTSNTFNIAFGAAGTNEVRCYIYGLTLDSNARDLVFLEGVNGGWTFDNCGFRWGAQGSPQYFRIAAQSGIGTFKDCFFNSYSTLTGPNFMFGRNSYIIFENCVNQVNAANICMFDTNGGSVIEYYGCDFSANTSTSSLFVIGYNVNNNLLDPTIVNMYNCKMGTQFDGTVSQAAPDTNQDSGHARCYQINMYNCSNGYDNYYFYSTASGTVASNHATYLNAVDKDNISFSFGVRSSSRCNEVIPLKQKIATVSNQDLTSAKTYHVEFTSSTLNLTKDDVWIELHTIDANGKGIILSSNDGDILNPSTTVHTTSTASWALPLTYKYKDSITTPVTTGKSNEIVEVWICVKKPDEDFYVDPAIGIS